MSAQDPDPNFAKWAQDWQADARAPHDAASAERIRQYVNRRGSMVRSFFVSDFVIGAIALPFLIYFSATARNEVERASMISLISITVAAIGFGWWNWRGVLKASAATTAEYLAISAERLRRMRLAWRIGWAVLTAEVVVFVIWIWDYLHSGARPHDVGAERFAWGWLAGFTLVAIVSLLWFGRWLTRDTERFEALRRELDS